MKSYLKFTPLIILMSCLGDSGKYKESYPQILAKGTLTDTKYSNDYFSLSVSLPTNWIILNKDEIDARNKIGQELLSKSIGPTNFDENKKPKSLIDINKFRQDAPEAWETNAGFQISFVKKEYFPDYSELSFLSNAKSILASSPLYKNISDIETAKIGGQSFFTYSSELHLEGFIVFQRSYIIDTRGCFLFVNTSYRGESVKTELDNVINSVILN